MMLRSLALFAVLFPATAIAQSLAADQTQPGSVVRTNSNPLMWLSGRGFAERVDYGSDQAVLNAALLRAIDIAPQNNIYRRVPAGSDCGDASQQTVTDISAVLPPTWTAQQVYSDDALRATLGGGYGTGHAMTMLTSPSGTPYLVDTYFGYAEVARMERLADGAYTPATAGESDNVSALGVLFPINPTLRFIPGDGSPLVPGSCPPQRPEPEPIDVQVVGSFDPNDKLGPTGRGAARFLTSMQPFRYTVRFENLPTATAPALEVLVVDTLNTAHFDLSTFRFGPVSFGGRTFYPDAGAASTFTLVVDVPPPTALRVLVSGALDAATGVVTWRFSSLDPLTGDIPTDPLAGFLPPNASPPEGEGSVFFTVSPHTGLASGQTIRNGARIYFDANEPIDTPYWTNTLDNEPPSSAVTTLSETQSDSLFTVSWAGSDGVSGVEAVTVYVSQDGGPFVAWLRESTETEATFHGQTGRTYGFYSIARDGAGNNEPPKSTAEATTGVVVAAGDGPSTPPVSLTLDTAAPNPFRDATTLRIGLPQAGPVTALVFDIRGREVLRLLDRAERSEGWHSIEMRAPLAPGIYVIHVRAGEETRVRRVTVLR